MEASTRVDCVFYCSQRGKCKEALQVEVEGALELVRGVGEVEGDEDEETCHDHGHFRCLRKVSEHPHEAEKTLDSDEGDQEDEAEVVLRIQPLLIRPSVYQG